MAILLKLCRISCIRHLQFSAFIKQQPMSEFVSFRLDYFNSLFVDLPDCLLNKIQELSIMLLTLQKADHITPLLHNLHWLSVCVCIKFIIAMHCIHVDDSLAPFCLSLCCPTSLAGQFALLIQVFLLSCVSD